MRPRGLGPWVLTVLMAFVSAAPAHAAQPAAIVGRVVRQDGSPVAGVMILLQATGAIEWTGADGRYRFAKAPGGSQQLLMTLGGYSTTVTIDAASTAPVDTIVDWPLSFVESMVVAAPSRHIEPVAGAPASVLVLDAAQIERQSGQAQLPSLLASAAGIQAPQSGLYDFNVNARGFNDMVSRRVRVEVDGRDTSQPHVMGNTDWASLPQALGEFEQLEFVRGPGGALYGQGALNGVLSLRTKDPASSLGGRARVTFGELGTIRLDGRHAGALGGGWFYKAVGGYLDSGDFSVSRNQSVEYEPGRLAREAVPLRFDRLQIAYGSGRLDRHFTSGARLELEAGTSYKEGPVTLTNLGRYQASDSWFPWLRGEVQSGQWQVTTALTVADIDRQLALSSGADTYQNAVNLQVDGQTVHALAAGRGRLLAGGSYSRQRVDSSDPQGVHTVFEGIETAQSGSGFAQLDFDLTRHLKTNIAARVDASSLTRTTFSPRAAIVWEVAPDQRVRLAYSDAFKAPTIAETRLRAAIAPPVDLSALEQALAPVLGGTSLGFSQVPVLAVGNESLEVEEVKSLEAGYTVVIGKRTFVQAAAYHNWHDTFTSGLLPQVGTSLGRLNPDFGPYRPPAALSSAQSAIVLGALSQALPPALYASMSNFDDGRPLFAALSLGNFGTATTKGLELSTLTMLPSGVRIDLAYSWFDSSVSSSSPETPLEPNTPHHQASGGVLYVQPRFDVGGRIRWVDAFTWVSGVYSGPVPSYTVVDLQATVPLNKRLSLGVDVANAFDNDHYEMFGGDIIRRRSLAMLTAKW